MIRPRTQYGVIIMISIWHVQRIRLKRESYGFKDFRGVYPSVGYALSPVRNPLDKRYDGTVHCATLMSRHFIVTADDGNLKEPPFRRHVCVCEITRFRTISCAVRASCAPGRKIRLWNDTRRRGIRGSRGMGIWSRTGRVTIFLRSLEFAPDLVTE